MITKALPIHHLKESVLRGENDAFQRNPTLQMGTLHQTTKEISHRFQKKEGIAGKYLKFWVCFRASKRIFQGYKD